MFPQTAPNNPSLTAAPSIINKFEATPSVVSPFGSSTLSWEVDASSGATVMINGVPMASSGQRIIQPSVNQTFYLVASRPGSPAELRSASVTVNLSHSIVRENSIVKLLIDYWLRRILSEDSRLTILFPNSAIPVAVLQEEIKFYVSLSYDDGTTFPPLNATAETSFRLNLVSSSPVVIGPRVVAASNVNVEFTPIPVNGFLPPPVPDENKIAAVAKIIKDIMPRLIHSAVALPTSGLPANMRLRSVLLLADKDHNPYPNPAYPDGAVFYTYCPSEGPFNSTP